MKKLIKKCQGGEKINSNEKEPSWLNKHIYNYVNPVYDYPDNLIQAGLMGIGSLIGGYKPRYKVTDLVADAAWRKRLGLDYDSKYLIDNGDNTFRLPTNIESEIPVDINKLQKRIEQNLNLRSYYVDEMGRDPKNELIQFIDTAINIDNNTLNALKKTYETGEPVVINEYSHNSRQLIDKGEPVYNNTPLNVLKNFTIKYNKDTNEMEYYDIYDFNQFEWGVPGKPFDIKGKIKLKKRK